MESRLFARSSFREELVEVVLLGIDARMVPKWRKKRKYPVWGTSTPYGAQVPRMGHKYPQTDHILAEFLGLSTPPSTHRVSCLEGGARDGCLNPSHPRGHRFFLYNLKLAEISRMFHVRPAAYLL